LFSPFHTDAALKRIEKNKKCDEQVKIRDEQARGVEIEGKMSADFLDRRIRLRKNNSGGTNQNRSGERLLQAARRVSAANQLTEFSEL
jgi:hypothetical protein